MTSLLIFAPHSLHSPQSPPPLRGMQILGGGVASFLESHWLLHGDPSSSALMFGLESYTRLRFPPVFDLRSLYEQVTSFSPSN